VLVSQHADRASLCRAVGVGGPTRHIERHVEGCCVARADGASRLVTGSTKVIGWLPARRQDRALRRGRWPKSFALLGAKGSMGAGRGRAQAGRKAHSTSCPPRKESEDESIMRIASMRRGCANAVRERPTYAVCREFGAPPPGSLNGSTGRTPQCAPQAWTISAIRMWATPSILQRRMDLHRAHARTNESAGRGRIGVTASAAGGTIAITAPLAIPT